MRVFISADIEGITDVTCWPDTEKGSISYDKAAAQMTAEVAAACRGALKAGADEVVVRDAHDSAMNIDHKGLPRGVKLIRGWASGLCSMMTSVEDGFDLCFMVGYHSPGYSDGNPLAPTMTHTGIMKTLLNGRIMSEMEYNGLYAARHGVPLGLVTGDKALCELGEEIFPALHTVAVKEGNSSATYNMHPDDAVDAIEEEAFKTVKAAMEGQIKPIEVPEWFELSIQFKEFAKAQDAARYPGAFQIDAHTVGFETHDADELFTAYTFMH